MADEHKTEKKRSPLWVKPPSFMFEDEGSVRLSTPGKTALPRSFGASVRAIVGNAKRVSHMSA